MVRSRSLFATFEDFPEQRVKSGPAARQVVQAAHVEMNSRRFMFLILPLSRCDPCFIPSLLGPDVNMSCLPYSFKPDNSRYAY
jgi:hypothetical protein